MATTVAWGVFEAIPQLEDEYVYYFQAKVFAQGSVTNPAAPVLEAFFMPNVILKDGRQFGKGLPGFPLLLTIGIWLGQPWIVNSLAAALGILAELLGD